MSKIDKVVSVEKSPVELLEHLAKLIVAVKANSASGLLSATAIPGDIAALVAELPPIVAACGQLSGDLAEDKLAFIKGLVIGADELAEAVLGK